MTYGILVVQNNENTNYAISRDYRSFKSNSTILILNFMFFYLMRTEPLLLVYNTINNYDRNNRNRIAREIMTIDTIKHEYK